MQDISQAAGIGEWCYEIKVDEGWYSSLQAQGGDEMIWLKACPRCTQVALYLSEDNSKRCMHCGYVRYASAAPTGPFKLARAGSGQDSDNNVSVICLNPAE